MPATCVKKNSNWWFGCDSTVTTTEKYCTKHIHTAPSSPTHTSFHAAFALLPRVQQQTHVTTPQKVQGWRDQPRRGVCNCNGKKLKIITQRLSFALVSDRLRYVQLDFTPSSSLSVRYVIFYAYATRTMSNAFASAFVTKSCLFEAACGRSKSHKGTAWLLRVQALPPQILFIFRKKMRSLHSTRFSQYVYSAAVLQDFPKNSQNERIKKSRDAVAFFALIWWVRLAVHVLIMWRNF